MNNTNNSILILNDENFDLVINKEKKFVLVNFTANWCSPCKMMYPILLQINNEYTNTLPKLIIAKLDIDKNPDITLKYSIKGIPTFILFYQNKIKDSKIGTFSKEELKKFINKNINI